ncbi:DnaJ C-terminal domain-containing protein [Paucibacter sp. Y2R2-4]|uniref:DnaJ C-terminal domain-containing protein n=1 Tax=Paucibacter sp. Y2R2-4 TaxID=2893553 RepID=UPI0021E46EF7|nr:DnaJ C-terminal domain-containing protein [Paucibacter sp. Y2R2-4]MCV2348535.1 DnaJ domain-containing protein [Paucibacter sp. Y2R2-4]
MEFKDYYAALGLASTATQAEVKRAYRKLARKFHPDVSKEPQAEARFKAVAEAHEALIDPERRAAYDEMARRHASGQDSDPTPGRDSGFEFSGAGTGHPRYRQSSPSQPGAEDFSDFFEALFGRAAAEGGARDGRRHGPVRAGSQAPSRDHHAKVSISLQEAFLGGPRMIALRMPVADASGHSVIQERKLEIQLPKGIRDGQHLRLAGQGAASGTEHGGIGPTPTPASDLYLEIHVLPDPVFRLDGSDVYFDLPITPWEAALGATLTAPTISGRVSLSVPAASVQGRRLRLKGLGLPGKVPGDLYAVLKVVQPPASSADEKAAYAALAAAFPAYAPRADTELGRP